jgi:hypothetical protein
MMIAVEWTTIIFALIMEAMVINHPEQELNERVPFLKKRSVWALALAIPLLVLSLLYAVYQFIWFLTDAVPYRFCGGLMLTLSALSVFRMMFMGGHKHKTFLRQADAGICFVCLTMIAYARLKGL